MNTPESLKYVTTRLNLALGGQTLGRLYIVYKRFMDICPKTRYKVIYEACSDPDKSIFFHFGT